MFIYYLHVTLHLLHCLHRVIELHAQFPDYLIENIRLDNASEFTFKAFDDYYMHGIDVKYPIPHVHSQNGLVEYKSTTIIYSIIINYSLPLIRTRQFPQCLKGNK